MSESSSDFAIYLLAEIECGIIRAKLWQNDLTAIGIALRTGLVDVDNALDHLAWCDALRLMRAVLVWPIAVSIRGHSKPI